MIADLLFIWLGFLNVAGSAKVRCHPWSSTDISPVSSSRPICFFPAGSRGFWGEDEPAFDSLDQTQTVIAAVMDHYNAIIAALDAGFKQLEAKQSVDYRPLFLAASDKPNHDVVRTWVRGFGKAMALAPRTLELPCRR